MPDTPDTIAYLGLGLVAGLGMIGFYVISLAVRFSNASKTIKVMDALRD